MNKKVKVLLIIFWCLVAGSLLYWVDIAFRGTYKNSGDGPVSSFPESSTLKWKTYKYIEEGFAISLPENFILKIEPQSINNPTDFEFSVVDLHYTEYLKVRASNKPADYKEPSGPFPKVITTEKYGNTTEPYVFNGIFGFRTKGAVEGGGGSYDYFEFVRDDKVWNIEFSAEEGNYSEGTFNKDIYFKIKDSFKLI